MHLDDDTPTPEANGRLTRRSVVLASLAAGAGFGPGVQAAPARPAVSAASDAAAAQAESRLYEVYRLIGAGQWTQAFEKSQALAKDMPRFTLAQVLYGDLLLARTHPLPGFAAVPEAMNQAAADQLAQLRAEARQRLEGFSWRPPLGSIPRQFMQLPVTMRHAVAVDASRSRMYVFENQGSDIKLLSDHYVSVGRLGTEKQIEGDQRTPLGVYFITSRLEQRQLDDFYGAGALPLNYPNEYDRRLGRTGGGIWLHGVPSASYSRPPNATDGCVALPNEELRGLLRILEPRRTPVVISQRLDWVQPETLEPQRSQTQDLLERWRSARSGDKADALSPFYSSQFQSGSQDLNQYMANVQRELDASKGKPIEMKDLSVLYWKHKSEVMVVTFGEIRAGRSSGPTLRQYWGKEAGQWKIFFEGIVG